MSGEQFVAPMLASGFFILCNQDKFSPQIYTDYTDYTDLICVHLWKSVAEILKRTVKGRAEDVPMLHGNPDASIRATGFLLFYWLFGLTTMERRL